MKVREAGRREVDPDSDEARELAKLSQPTTQPAAKKKKPPRDDPKPNG